MDREKLFRHLEQRYSSKRDMCVRIPLGVQPDALWQELLNHRRSKATILPLYGSNGTPYWYVTTDKMVAASEKIVDALIENEGELDLYAEAPPVSTLEEVFFTSYVEGSQISMQAAMDFLTGDLPPRDVEEQLIANNRMAGSYASGNLYRSVSPELLQELAYILTEGMDTGGQEFRSADVSDCSFAEGEPLVFPSPLVIPDRLNDLCSFLSSQAAHPLIKAAVAQAYLLILRPFPDGNERLGRIVSSMILLRAGYSFFSDVSLSALIARKSYAYYEAMANTLREENGNDLTYFVEYYLELLSRAVDERRLRVQRREEQARQAEIELARTPLSAPPAKDNPAPAPVVAPAPSDGRDCNQDGQLVMGAPSEEGWPLEGFFAVCPTERDPGSVAEEAADSTTDLARVQDILYGIAENSGEVMQKAALLLLDFLDQGITTFTVDSLQSKLSITSKQSSNLMTHMKEKGVIVSCEERVNRFMRYRFCTNLPLLVPEDYAPEIVRAVRTLRNSSSSVKDRRIGELLTACMPKGIVSEADYVELGPLEKLAADLSLPEKMGIVTKLRTGLYRINRTLKKAAPSLTMGQKTVLSKLHRSFGEKEFMSDNAIDVLPLSKASVNAYLHLLSLLQILDCQEGPVNIYRIRMTPGDYPELYVKFPEEVMEETPEASLPEQPDLDTDEEAQPPGLFTSEVYDLLQTLAASVTSQRDRRLADVVGRCLQKGVLLQSDYKEWGYSHNIWLGDMKLARQLGLARKLTSGVYALNRRLKPELMPQQKKTVSAIYETFGDQEFSSDMFLATLNYSISYTYASLHKLTLLRILDQRSTEEGSQYQLLVNPEDHPECFDSVA